MSNALWFATPRKTSRGNLLAGWLDGGAIQVYTAPRPDDADTAITTQTLLVTFTLPDPAASVSDGVLTGNAIEPVLIAETGTAAWARFVDSAAATIGDGDVGLEDSGAFVELDTLSLVEGRYCSVVSFSIAEG